MQVNPEFSKCRKSKYEELAFPVLKNKITEFAARRLSLHQEGYTHLLDLLAATAKLRAKTKKSEDSLLRGEIDQTRPVDVQKHQQAIRAELLSKEMRCQRGIVDFWKSFDLTQPLEKEISAIENYRSHLESFEKAPYAALVTDMNWFGRRTYIVKVVKHPGPPPQFEETYTFDSFKFTNDHIREQYKTLDCHLPVEHFTCMKIADLKGKTTKELDEIKQKTREIYPEVTERYLSVFSYQMPQGSIQFGVFGISCRVDDSLYLIRIYNRKDLSYLDSLYLYENAVEKLKEKIRFEQKAALKLQCLTITYFQRLKEAPAAVAHQAKVPAAIQPGIDELAAAIDSIGTQKRKKGKKVEPPKRVQPPSPTAVRPPVPATSPRPLITDPKIEAIYQAIMGHTDTPISGKEACSCLVSLGFQISRKAGYIYKFKFQGFVSLIEDETERSVYEKVTRNLREPHLHGENERTPLSKRRLLQFRDLILTCLRTTN